MKNPPAILLLLGAALALRCAIAVADQARPVFRPHHYGDARSYDASARKLLDAWKRGGPRENLPPGRELHVITTAVLYRTFGERPLIPRIVNALLATASLFLWYLLAAEAVSPQAALISLALLAFWPSHAFYTSQNLKESFSLFLFWGAFLGVVRALPGDGASGPRARLARLGAGLASLFVFGFLRAPLVPFTAAALMVGCAAAALRARSTPGSARACAFVFFVLLAAGAGFGPVIARIRPALSGPPVRTAEVEGPPPGEVRPTAGPASLFSPEGLTRIRRSRLYSSRHWSYHHAGRKIETQIFPEAEFTSWFDVARFLPKASFYAMFMPLPGLYPIEGKIGRAASAAENSLLLLVALAALWGWLRVPKTPAVWSLAAFLILTVPASSLFEFDLGSAARHRLLFFQPLFLFAAAGISGRLLSSRRGEA